MDLRDALSRRFRVAPEDLPATLVFDHPTSAALAAHILSLLPDACPSASTGGKAAAGASNNLEGAPWAVSRSVSGKGAPGLAVVEVAAAACMYPGSQRGADFR